MFVSFFCKNRKCFIKWLFLQKESVVIPFSGGGGRIPTPDIWVSWIFILP